MLYLIPEFWKLIILMYYLSGCFTVYLNKNINNYLLNIFTFTQTGNRET